MGLSSSSEAKRDNIYVSLPVSISRTETRGHPHDPAYSLERPPTSRRGHHFVSDLPVLDHWLDVALLLHVRFLDPRSRAAILVPGTSLCHWMSENRLCQRHTCSRHLSDNSFSV